MVGLFVVSSAIRANAPRIAEVSHLFLVYKNPFRQTFMGHIK